MLKNRLMTLGIIILAAGLGFCVYWSQHTGRHPFKLGLDLSGGTYLTYRADVSKVSATDIPTAMDSLRDVIERRVNLFGVSEPRVTTETTTLGGLGREYHLIVELPGVTDTKKAIEMIGQTPLLEFKVEDPNYKPGAISITPADIKDGKIDISSALADQNAKYKSTPLTGQYLSRATLQFDQQTHAPTIGLQFNTEGAKLFEQITGDNVGKTVAIYLDGSVLSAPRVNQKISGGQAVITGTFTPAEAKTLVARLNSGALPVPVALISTDAIGPTLGAGAIHAGLLAGLVGLLAIVVLLIVWYRVPGIIATVSLAIYALIMLGLFKAIPVVLTSAGIAGFIISLGMAVDANILIFERMKEELHGGKTIAEAARAGFDRAWNSIRDGNISSIISAIVLYSFGTTLIKGFAVTFGLGVIVSMISAVTVSRIFLVTTAGVGNGRIKRFLFSSGISK